MKNFKKTVMPGYLPEGPNGAYKPMHVTIAYRDGKLSITGVVGAAANGNCYGSFGQCHDELLRKDFKLALNWTAEDVNYLNVVWNRWPLNDMRPCCEHQREAGWLEKADETLHTYTWRLKDEVPKDKKMIESNILETVKRGEGFPAYGVEHPFTKLLNLPRSITTVEPSAPSAEYEPWEGFTIKHVKTSKAGHTFWTEAANRGACDGHPDGLLGKPCPICGYKYGSAWQFEEVPESVLKWLYELPYAEKRCAWGKA